jgi:hypothetical protein
MAMQSIWKDIRSEEILIWIAVSLIQQTGKNDLKSEFHSQNQQMLPNTSTRGMITLQITEWNNINVT